MSKEKLKRNLDKLKDIDPELAEDIEDSIIIAQQDDLPQLLREIAHRDGQLAVLMTDVKNLMSTMNTLLKDYNENKEEENRLAIQNYEHKSKWTDKVFIPAVITFIGGIGALLSKLF